MYTCAVSAIMERSSVALTCGLILSSGSAVFWCVCLSVGGWFAAGRQFNLCVCLIPISVVLTLVLTLVIVRVAKIEEQV